MRSIIAKKSRGGGNSLKLGVGSCELVGKGNAQTLTRVTRRILLAAAVALGLATTANAATAIYWKGGSGTEAEPKDVYDKNNWTGSNTYSGNSINQNPTGQHNFNFKAGSLTYLTNHSPSADSGYICEQIFFHAGNYSLCGFFTTKSSVNVGTDVGDEAIVTVNGGSVTVGDALYVGGSSTAGGTGTLTINGGNVVVAAGKNTLAGFASGSTGTINLNGGILTTTRIAKDKGKGYINFNGGKLQANADNNDYIKDGVGITVLAGGGTIDCNGKNIAINAQWSAESTGGMNFTGGNGNTISIINLRVIQYPGITSIAPGTRLAVSNLSASKNVISNGIVVVGVPAVGDVIFTCTRGDGYTLDGVSLDNVKCPIAPDTVFELDDTKTNIVVTSVGTLAPAFWTGAAGDDNLSTPGNWSDNTVPTGNATISRASPATLTKGAAFAPTAITFGEGSAAVTIDGGDFTGVVAVTNLSSSSHTFNAKVYFAGDIQVKQAAMGYVSDLAKPHVTFAGGAYAAPGRSLESGNFAAVYSRCIFGKYYLSSTSASRWTAQYQGGNKRVCVADGSCLYVPYAGNVTELYVGNGAKVDVGDMETSDRPAYQVYGEMVVSNLTATGSTTIYATYNQGLATPGVFKFGAVTNKLHSSGGSLFCFADAYDNTASSHVFYIGEGGLNFDTSRDLQSSIFVIGRDKDGQHETIRPWYSDFTIGARPGNDNPAGLRFFHDVEFCTDDENGTRRTITLEARTQVQANKTAAITVSGSGTLKVTQPNDNGAQPTVTLAGTATLEYTTAAATLGTGTLTLGAGTTFAFVNNSRELALPSPIVLPTDGVATLRIGGTRLTSGKHTIATDVAADAADHLVVDPASAALDGRKTTLAVEDGNLVLNVKSFGLKVIVR